ncbi:MAG: type II secretion system protein [Atopobiaceae bacterium]|jgi:prepilin-type N-terminal cleavage/methylation domain-containing protein|nr:type II secretion system GspH family protein [Atopobiaceae bacterium]MCH4181035.1 type II secretion system GspH family protein [Atopobiaceae bacterium]MCH4213760.1 type II secretion system GspH family protein [Atopobiaceae bacterium]MCH4230547.1 type II secretion system GspH family protein [Atopobiaceae bacterium]MCH4277046.1 type II secretion system GspH family protein [Atopobiaceae bacterium]
MDSRGTHTGARPRLRARAHAGFTLIESLAALLIVVMLTSVVVAGVNVGMHVFRESSFISESTSLADSLDASIQDPAHFAKGMTYDGEPSYRMDFLGQTLVDPDLTTHDVSVTEEDGTTRTVSVLALKGISLSTGKEVTCDLLNAGAYTECQVTSAKLEFSPSTAVDGTAPDTVKVTFTIASTVDPTLTKSYTYTYTPSDTSRL